MKKITLCSLFLFSVIISFSQPLTEAVDTNQTVIIKMQNGDEFKGQILKQDSSTVLLKTSNGEMDLISKSIKSIEVSKYNGKFLFKNSNDTRYFFGPSAIPIKKREGYYQNIYGFFNAANYGITENISVGGGFELLSLVRGNPFWYLTPKAGFKLKEKIHLGGGLLVAGLGAEGTATLGYGVFTYGSSDSNLSAGLGYGFVDGEVSNYPTIFFAGSHRVSNSIMLLTENYIIPNSFNEVLYFGIHGVRILAKKNTFDLGLISIPIIAEEVPVLPYVSYVRVF